jgi:hypothetical protein
LLAKVTRALPTARLRSLDDLPPRAAMCRCRDPRCPLLAFDRKRNMDDKSYHTTKVPDDVRIGASADAHTGPDGGLGAEPAARQRMDPDQATNVQVILVELLEVLSVAVEALLGARPAADLCGGEFDLDRGVHAARLLALLAVAPACTSYVAVMQILRAGSVQGLAEYLQETSQMDGKLVVTPRDLQVVLLSEELECFFEDTQNWSQGAGCRSHGDLVSIGEDLLVRLARESDSHDALAVPTGM